MSGATQDGEMSPTPEMKDALKRDYQAMARMIFGEVPDLAKVLVAVRQLELAINQVIKLLSFKKRIPNQNQ